MIKIDVSKLSYTKETILKEVVNFDPEEFKCYPPLLEVKKADVNIKIRRYEDFVYVNMQIKASVSLQCSYTLKAFDTVLKSDEELHFASYVEEGDDVFFETIDDDDEFDRVQTYIESLEDEIEDEE